MKFKIIEWTLKELYEMRNEINFPVFQRENIWYASKKEKLIDSIMRGIDIPKLYIYTTKEELDIIDGQQRIRSIIGFFDEELKWSHQIYTQLTEKEKNIFDNYKLTIAKVSEITEEEIRLLFTRLQLGIPANSGEKLNAILSNMGEFVKELAKYPFIKNISIPKRRFAKQQVCAQICNNSMYLNKMGEFRNSKYQDLENFYRTNKNFDLNSKEANSIRYVFKKLNDIFMKDVTKIRNRGSTVTIYFLVEEMIIRDVIPGKEDEIKEFYLEFLLKLKEEVNIGIDATNRFLINYQSRLIQGADAKGAISERHDKLKEAFNYYLQDGEIIGFD